MKRFYSFGSGVGIGEVDPIIAADRLPTNWVSTASPQGRYDCFCHGAL